VNKDLLLFFRKNSEEAIDK